VLVNHGPTWLVAADGSGHKDMKLMAQKR